MSTRNIAKKEPDTLAKDSIEAKEKGLSYGQLQQLRYKESSAREKREQKTIEQLSGTNTRLSAI